MRLNKNTKQLYRKNIQNIPDKVFKQITIQLYRENSHFIQNIMYSGLMKSTILKHVFYRHVLILHYALHNMINSTVNMILINSVYKIPCYVEMHVGPKIKVFINIVSLYPGL